MKTGQHPLTLDQLEESHVLFIGQTRSGKTYQLRGAIEQLRRAGRRVGAIDKLGNHWGLTIAADGTGPGLEFVIFGGKRDGAIPMMPSQGFKLGRLFVERSIPAIFDVSQWDQDEQRQWVAEFADAVFRFNEGPLHLAVDEAQSWIPLNGGGPAHNAVLKLLEQGLGNGIHLMLSVQRLARLDATARGMTPLVVAMRQTSTTDRNAVADLVAVDAKEATRLKLDLPNLPAGTGYIWDPGSGGLSRHAFPPNSTYDSSRTPKHGDTPVALIGVSNALVDELRLLLAPARKTPATIGEQLAIREADAIGFGLSAVRLKTDLDLAQGRATALERQNEAHLQTIMEAEHRFLALLTSIQSVIEPAIQAAMLRLGEPHANLHRDTAHFESDRDPGAPALPSPSRDASGRGAATSPPDGPPADQAAGGPVRGRRALQVLAAAHPSTLTEEQWALIAGFTRSGGTWGTYKGALRASGLVDQIDGRWTATTAGIAEIDGDLPAFSQPGPALATDWGKRAASTGKLVAILIKRWPHFVTRDSLAADAGMAAGGGTFGTYLGRLRAKGLIDENGKRLRLAPALMEPQ